MTPCCSGMSVTKAYDDYCPALRGPLVKPVEPESEVSQVLEFVMSILS
jgi:shikimate kinase